MPIYELLCSVTATGTVRAKVTADSPDDAVRELENYGIAGLDWDGDEFLDLAHYDADLDDDPVELCGECVGRGCGHCGDTGYADKKERP